MFTHSCYIHKNTPLLRNRLKQLGYKIFPINAGFPCLSACNGIAIPADSFNRDGYIDCGTNEELFLSIAALRDDSDNMQFFRITDLTTGIIVDECVRLPYGKRACKGRFQLNKYHDYLIEKLSPQELTEHFKN